MGVFAWGLLVGSFHFGDSGVCFGRFGLGAFGLELLVGIFHLGAFGMTVGAFGWELLAGSF